MTWSPFLQCQQWRGSAEKLDGLGERSFSSGEMPLSEQVKTHSSFFMNASLGFFFFFTCSFLPQHLWSAQSETHCSPVLPPLFLCSQKKNTHQFPWLLPHQCPLFCTYMTLPISRDPLLLPLSLLLCFQNATLSTSPCFLLCFWVLFLIFLTGSYICNHPINVAISPGSHLLLMNPVTPNITLGGSH